jgi:hypothetical protein
MHITAQILGFLRIAVAVRALLLMILLLKELDEVGSAGRMQIKFGRMWIKIQERIR